MVKIVDLFVKIKLSYVEKYARIIAEMNDTRAYSSASIGLPEVYTLGI